MSPRFSGAYVAIVTPFKNGRVDEEALRALVEFQIAAGTDGIVPCGTTGESATLSHDEHGRVVEIVVKAAAKRVPVLAGTGSNSTDEAIALTRRAKTAGADGALLITPYYNKPTQDGLVRHFRAVADAVDIPIVLYNVPGRTAVNMLPAAVEELSRHPRIVGIKEATANLDQISEVIERCGPDFAVISGDDMTFLPTLAIGGVGVISVTANVAPDRIAALYDAWTRGDRDEALRVHQSLQPLNRAMFLETNPIPVKTALSLMGRCSDEMRLPLSPMGEGNKEKLRTVLRTAGLVRA
ncbi:MAG: 4-hydroxy-tetrahydrodipicolinate synthase [Nitrospirae bacterium RBG_16_64_22]|nr:MAG: 4-hydroxy-tetrahydrodipicolinate synthase [Nitrospirae bacterium RBG_16_64_22]